MLRSVRGIAPSISKSLQVPKELLTQQVVRQKSGQLTHESFGLKAEGVERPGQAESEWRGGIEVGRLQGDLDIGRRGRHQ